MTTVQVRKQELFIKLVTRLPMLIPGFLALGVGTLAGLWRMGWDLQTLPQNLAQLHGPLMVAGFFGTVIGLERAVALGRWPAYLAPVLNGVGVIAFFAGAPYVIAGTLMILGAVVFTAASLAVMKMQPVVHIALLVVGALFLVFGNIAAFGLGNIDAALPWWIGFLVLTIVGERLELSRLRPTGTKPKVVLQALAIAFIGAAVGVALDTTGADWLFGTSLVGFAVWLALYDIARHTIRQSGLVRYVAVCLLGGYAWLAVGGAIWATAETYDVVVYARDAGLHAIFLGFVMTMVFGHAPIIFPAVTGMAVPYHKAFYLHLIVLHASLGLRLVGDTVDLEALRLYGSLGNAVALALFILNTVLAVRRGVKARDQNRPAPATPPAQLDTP